MSCFLLLLLLLILTVYTLGGRGEESTLSGTPPVGTPLPTLSHDSRLQARNDNTAPAGPTSHPIKRHRPTAGHASSLHQGLRRGPSRYSHYTRPSVATTIKGHPLRKACPSHGARCGLRCHSHYSRPSATCVLSCCSRNSRPSARCGLSCCSRNSRPSANAAAAATAAPVLHAA